MSKLRVIAKGPPAGAFAKALTGLQKPIARAASKTMRELGAELKLAARADIAAGGFSTRWQNALRVQVFPERKESIDAAIYLKHNIPYAEIFEKGGTVTGHPLLWLPLRNAPQRIGRKRITPALFEAAGGKLRRARGVSPPLLLAPQAASRSKSSRLTLSSLKRGATGKGVRWVPLFVGISAAHIKKHFHIRAIVRQVAARLATVYQRNFRGN